jgi:hypothetical protein
MLFSVNSQMWDLLSESVHVLLDFILFNLEDLPMSQTLFFGGCVCVKHFNSTFNPVIPAE